MPLDDLTTPPPARPGARWPWFTLALGAAIVAVGGFAFSPAEPPVRADQPASLAGPTAP